MLAEETKLEFSKYELGEMGKVCGAHIHEWKFPNVFDELNQQGCKDDFLQVMKFVRESQRTGISTFVSKMTKLFTNFVSNSPGYQSFDEAACKAKSTAIKEELKTTNGVSVVLSFENQGGVNKRYVSCDIICANFTCVKKLLDLDMALTWYEFFKALVPYDERGQSHRNVRDGTAGQKCVLPECLYRSKYMRVHILSCLPKLQILWEYEALLLAKWITSTNVVMSIKSDEVILLANDRGVHEALELFLQNYESISLFRVRCYVLANIPGFRLDNFVKMYSDKTFALVNVSSRHYSLALRAAAALPQVRALKNNQCFCLIF